MVITTSYSSPILPWTEIVICIDAPEDMTEQGVLIAPGTDEKKKPEKGIVVAVGQLEDPKKKLPYTLKPGDLIFYERYIRNEISHQGKKYNFFHMKHIMGVIPQ